MVAKHIIGVWLFTMLLYLTAPVFSAVVVEELVPGGAARRAGVEVGDEVDRWWCAGSSPDEDGIELGTPFDLMMVEIEQAPLCSVVLSGSRNGVAKEFEVPPGEWRMRVRPLMSGPVLGLYEEAIAAVAVGDVDGAVSGLRAVADVALQREDAVLAMWALHRCSLTFLEFDRTADAETVRRRLEVLSRASGLQLTLRLLLFEGLEMAEEERYPQAKLVFDEARVLAGSDAPGTLLEAFVLAERAGTVRRLGLLEEAELDHTKALAIRESLVPGSMAVAASLNGLANIAFVKGDLETAAEIYGRSQAIRAEIAPLSLESSGTWNNLGNVALYMGDLDGAEAAHRKALAISEQIAPDSERIGLSLNCLGIVASDRGDLETAEAYYNRALALYEEYAPGSLDSGGVLMNLGVVAGERGDLESAESYFRANLAILEKLSPGSMDVAGVYNNLGLVAMERGNLEQAEAFHRASLEITSAMNPVSPDVASSYENLGFVMVLKEDFDRAEEYLNRSLAINRELAPGSWWEAGSFTNLGKVAVSRGDYDAARESYDRAYDILSDLAGEGIQMASLLWNLGEVAIFQGDLEAAEAYHQRALDLRRTLAPGRVEEADSLNALGVVRRLQAKDDARELLGAAIDLLEAQNGRVGGSAEDRATFRARRYGYYWDSLDLLVEEGDFDGAYGVLERSRAQVLLDVMATRDLDFTVDVPAELDQERRRTDAEFDRLQDELAHIPAGEDEYFEYISAELRRVRGDRGTIRERIRRASPRYAALGYPSPLGGAAAVDTLQQGTVVLAYAVGNDRSHIFTLSKGREIGVKTVPAGKAQLSEMVRSYRGLLRSPGDGASIAVLQAASSVLFEVLVSPVSHVLDKADRVVIVPDGPLHLVPFAALGSDTGNGFEYLVQKFPLSVVSSLTLAADLRSRRDSRRTTRVAVLADPEYTMPADGEMAARRSAGNLVDLPATRVEAAAISELYGDHAQLWLGQEATEERARSIAPGTPIVHFAAHVRIDGRFPLESAVYLSPGTDDPANDGILHAWEVFESLRIDADLVALSGCETALGREVAGEGLIGLTRAFQYAGARSVLASLWRVEDETTAELMRRFYEGLRAGTSADEALRLAQVGLITGPVVVPDTADGVFDGISRWIGGLLGKSEGREVDASHPFYWAAFRLEGDWK